MDRDTAALLLADVRHLLAKAQLSLSKGTRVQGLGELAQAIRGSRRLVDELMSSSPEVANLLAPDLEASAYDIAALTVASCSKVRS